jgi:hypothetical protein
LTGCGMTGGGTRIQAVFQATVENVHPNHYMSLPRV